MFLLCVCWDRGFFGDGGEVFRSERDKDLGFEVLGFLSFIF